MSEVVAKKPWESKTIIVNLLIAVAPFVPGADEYLKANPELLTTLFAVVNVILRLVTKGKVEIK